MLGLHFTPACVLLSVCSLHFTLSLHFSPGPQSAVRSPHSSFYSDRKLEGLWNVKSGIKNPESGIRNSQPFQMSPVGAYCIVLYFFC